MIIERLTKIKRLLKKVFAVLVIIILAMSPYLLVIDFKAYSPAVVVIWVLSAVYYLFVKEKN